MFNITNKKKTRLIFFIILLITPFVFFQKNKLKHLIQTENTNQKSTYYTEKVSQFKLIGRSKSDVLFIGDSLIDNAEWHELINANKVINRGIQGTTTENLITLLPVINLSEAPTVVLMIGINDIKREYSVKIITENYERIIDNLVSRHGSVFVTSLLLDSDNQIHLRKVISLNTAINNIAKKYPTAKYIDLYKQLTINGKLSSEYSVDGTHLNGKGYQQWSLLLNNSIGNHQE